MEKILSRREMSTILVTVGISWNTTLSSVSKMILREIGTSRNIKDKSTGKKVYKALDRILEFLKTDPDISNGLWILSAYDGLWSISPRVPLCRDYYFCGKKFYTDELSNIQEKKVGIVKLSISESTISIKEGEYNRVIHKITSGIPSNHHKGGQSQGRYTRKREEAVKEYTKRIAVYIRSMIVDEWVYEGNAEMISILTQ